MQILLKYYMAFARNTNSLTTRNIVSIKKEAEE